MLDRLRHAIPPRHPLRLLWHACNAAAAALAYGYPARRITVIGVTGTKGKTTTTNLIAQLLIADRRRVGLISTAVFRIGERQWDNTMKMTTPSPWVIQKMLKDMVDDGCEYAVLEVSSHALDQYRMLGVSFDIAVLTQIAEDHIEYHGSKEAYVAAKRKLFTITATSDRKEGRGKLLVLNADDEYFARFARIHADRQITYSSKGGSASLRAVGAISTQGGSEYVLELPADRVKVSLPLPGAYNLQNAMAATAVAYAEGVSLPAIKEALAQLRPVPGRMQPVVAGQPFNVFVDYAHTEDSMRQVFQALDKGEGRVIALFGCVGGGRDKAKRPKMAHVAEQYADIVIVTDDDPYEEPPLEILHQVVAGFSAKMQLEKNLHIIPDRRAAIALALALAQPGDTVLLLGKGSEAAQMIYGKAVPHHDATVAREVLEGMGYK